MSDEQLRAFLDAVKADAGLQLKLKSLNDPDAMVVVARDAGYEISAEDLQRAQVELTENELEDVSGGAWSFFHSPWHKKTNFTC